MKLGIVGHAEEKFCSITRQAARAVIRDLINEVQPELIISGHSPMGGIDIWAIEKAKQFNIPVLEFAPTHFQWEGKGGFKERNLKIARVADLVVCIVVAEYPPGFVGMKFQRCYHCTIMNPPHVKSGGCWTAWKARDRRWVIIQPDGKAVYA